MSVLIATSAGATFAIDVAVDSVSDRLAALSRHLGPPSSWTVSSGTIKALRDGAEALEVEAEVAGPLSAAVQLRAPGPQVIAVSPVLSLASSGDKAILRFRVARAREKDLALAGAP